MVVGPDLMAGCLFYCIYHNIDEIDVFIYVQHKSSLSKMPSIIETSHGLFLEKVKHQFLHQIYLFTVSINSRSCHHFGFIWFYTELFIEVGEESS
jgi:hypothetical protein